MKSDKVIIIDFFMEPAIYCFPKKYYSNKEDAENVFNQKYKNENEILIRITENQVRLIRQWYRCSYDTCEYDEKIEYMYMSEYRPNKKYSERYARSCWCFETDLSKIGLKRILE